MLPNATILLKQSWEIYKKRFWVFLGIVIVPLFALSLSASVLFPLRIKVGKFGVEFFNALSFKVLAIIFLFVLISAILHLWSQSALFCAVKDREENIGVKESFRQGWNKIASLFWIYLLSEFIIVVGSLLFFVPGLIFLIWFIFAPAVLIVENKKGFSALLASKEYVKGNWLAVFWRFLIFLFLMWLILSVISSIFGFVGIGNINKINLYIGCVLFAPFSVIYLVLIYENLKKIKIDKPISQKPNEEK